MKQVNRLENIVKKDELVNFSFNGKAYQGCIGDTIAAALIANNVKLIGRSFKYRRPRGILTADSAEPNAIVQVEKGEHTIPNVLATQAEIYEGMVIESVNCSNPHRDLRSGMQLFSRMIPAGFYYKTFMWPKSFWKSYEHLIRKAAGFGKSPTEADPSTYDSIFAHCDILIVGAGPTGICAALEAAESGARVILVDENAKFGGSLLSRKAVIDGKDSSIWSLEKIEELKSYENVTLLNRSTAFGYYDHNLIYVLERKENHLPLSKRKNVRERIWKIRTKKTILATGALERPMLFVNNDKPGVMLASAVLKYLNCYGVATGNKYVVYTNNDSAYKTVFELTEKNQSIAAVIDNRSNVSPKIEEKLTSHSIKLYKGYAVLKASGCKDLKNITIQQLSHDKSFTIGDEEKIDCDILAVSGGWSPVIHLSSQSGAKAIWSDDKNCFLPGNPVQEEVSIGSCAGYYDLKESIKQTAEEVAKVIKDLGYDHKNASFPETIESFDPCEQSEFSLLTNNKSLRRSGKQFVDFQNDVTAGDIELAASEGYHSIEHVKRYTALGFGTDQGKLGNVLGMNILAKVLNKKAHEVGTTTFRPAYTPVTFGAMAGMNTRSLFSPVRKTPIHYWHEDNGAEFENVGDWKRAWYYTKETTPKETMHDSLNRETLATHNSIGIMDASTLGKIDIQGPDAAAFLNLIYTNAWLKLGIGKCRYGIMLGEDGMVMDDGVTMRLAENHFVMTTTTGGAAKILAWLERWLQVERPELKVYLTSVTDHYSAMAISGPNSRKLVAKICPDIDCDSEEFPFMAVRDGNAAGVPARVMRISFTGELSYEIHINSNYARHVWEAVMKEGKQYNITPYGTETMHILRAEKGFIIVGQDTDGTVTPHDLDMDWIVSKKKLDFIGKPSLDRPAMLEEDRKQLVGLVTDNPLDVIPEGAQIVNKAQTTFPIAMEGHVTSSYYSAIEKKSIALALIKNGFNRQEETVYAALANGKFIKAKITKSVFYDPKGDRQNV